MSDDCIFCAIVAGSIPSTAVIDTETVYAFRDIHPQAPVHVLVVPKAHADTLADAARANPAVLAEMALVAQQVADAECGGSFRLIVNTGEDAGQTVAHAHAHVLGGVAFDPGMV